MRWAWLAMVACYNPVQLVPSDGASDGPGADLPANCKGTHFVTYCFDNTEPLNLSLSTPMIDTDTEPTCRNDVAHRACVIAAQTLTVIGGDFEVRGSRPLALFASSELIVTSGTTLSVASTLQPPVTGAGALTNQACVSSQPLQNAGGGAGGSFGSRGGDGGPELDTDSQPVARTPMLATTFVGGCPGDPGFTATGGVPGGALYLYASDTVTISGTVDAGGAGGEASPGLTNAGGGGGGTGGLIILDASTIEVDGSVLARGGGGAGGAGSTQLGMNGADASVGGGGGPAGAGGGGGGSGAVVGNGSTGEFGHVAQAGAGGGGGGDGIILTTAPVMGGGLVSPFPGSAP